MSRNDGLRELFSFLRELDQRILSLRLEPLPQPALLMLVERSKELSEALRLSVKKVYKRKRQAQARGWVEPLQALKQTLVTAYPLLRQLRGILRDVRADLTTAEACVRYDDFSLVTKTLKQRLRSISADTEKRLKSTPPDHLFAEKRGELKGLARQVGQLTRTIAELNQRVNEKILHYCAEFDAIFTLLETEPALADVNRDVLFELRGIAYKSIAASGFFEEAFCLSQLPEDGKGVRDALKSYLTQAHEASPWQFFNDSYYRGEYPSVHMLRYSPFEHFAR